MGLLSEGTPLSWEETKAKADHVREHGITQFINLWKRHKDVKKDCLLWGDEVEYTLVHLDHEKEKSSLLLKGDKVLHVLQQQERENPADLKTIWRPEYANYMVEGTPGKPYGGLMAYFNMVEANMRRRRKEVMRLLSEPGETALSVVTFPRLGCPNFSRPEFQPTPTEGASRSLFYPEEVIFPGHPRFKTLTRNIRQRRGEKVAINIPIFKDKNTPSPFQEDLSQYGDSGESQAASLPDHIYLDAMGFGMGCSCLQMTFQACNIDEARHLYDQLAPLCPIIMALSAGSPIYRGFLSDIDCRWFVISNSVDCRTREERGLEPLQKDRFRIHKSRYDTIDSYLGPCNACYNDIDMVYDRDICSRLKAAGVDELLARHVAHLFIRDPISLFSEKIDQNDEEESDHFENIQSTNWQSMRFKPPPPNSDIGWRVEFRPTEVQLTDFENAAYVVFVVLLTRVILSFHLNLVIPISKVDQNMKTAAKRDALRQGKFYFKKDLLTGYSPPKASECICNCPCGNVDISRAVDAEDEYTEMTINEIINGKEEDGFPGLVPLMEAYLTNIETLDVETRCTISQYLKLISKRAAGELKTTARWMRDFVTSHPDYKQDSVVSEKIAYDLMKTCDLITKEKIVEPDLLFPIITRTQESIPHAVKIAEQHLNDKHAVTGHHQIDHVYQDGTLNGNE